MPLPIVLLTRPFEASKRMKEQLTGVARVVISPLVEIRPVGRIEIPSDAAAYIFTSSNGVDHAPNIGRSPCFVVGVRTAARARSRGWNVQHVAENAAMLVNHLLCNPPPTPIVHLHGEHTIGDICARLTAAGIAAESHILYTQPVFALSETAIKLLKGDNPIFLPLYSARTARQFAKEHVGNAPLHIIAISEAVAQEVVGLAHNSLFVVPEPTGLAMMQALAGRLDAACLLETDSGPK